MKDDFNITLWVIVFIVGGLALGYCFGWIAGCLLSRIIGDAVVDGMNRLFDTNRFTVDMLPTICGIIGAIYSFFSISVSNRSKRGD